MQHISQEPDLGNCCPHHREDSTNHGHLGAKEKSGLRCRSLGIEWAGDHDRIEEKENESENNVSFIHIFLHPLCLWYKAEHPQI